MGAYTANGEEQALEIGELGSREAQ